MCVQNYKELELLRLVYYGGVEHGIRKEVWPFLLGHYKFGMGKNDMSQVNITPPPHTGNCIHITHVYPPAQACTRTCPDRP